MRSPYRVRHRYVISALALVLGVAACGDDSSDAADASHDTDPPPVASDGVQETTPDADDDAPDAVPASAVGSAGTVNVGDVTYAIDTTRTCDPDDFAEVVGADVSELVSQELSLQGFGDPGTQIDVRAETIGELSNDNVTWIGPEGTFDSEDFEGDDFGGTVSIDIDGDRVTGDGELTELMGNDTIEISFDLAIPSSHSECW